MTRIPPGIDSRIYKKMKEIANAEGLSFTELLNKALDEWLHNISEKNDIVDQMRDMNRRTSRKLLPKYLSTHQGKWMLISEGEFIDVYETVEEIYKAIEKKGLVERYNLLAEIVPEKRRISLGSRLI